ncbi:hypothetical protein [Alkalibaculum sporogenes]|uniref:hypothetical protein n=1 Tax=Alkalibaculum sporogenes TaxID=2655001 RepID=UPI00187B4146|nr:hypothetical protein [Alkalibaculum sporogenes]
MGKDKIIKNLRNMTHDYTVLDDGCNTYKITFAKLQEMESDMFQHIHLENNIIFSRRIAKKAINICENLFRI